MHYVSKINLSASAAPKLYVPHSTGFRRATYVDHTMGSTHMGTGICQLETEGLLRPHLHAFEETFYILEGNVIAQIADHSILLGPGHFGLIRTGTAHGWRNVSSQPVRWLEMQAPQPRSPERSRDTFFVGGDIVAKAVPPEDLEDSNLVIGHFDEAKLPSPGSASQMEGFNPTTGVAIKMFADRSFGAVHQSLFLVQYAPGAKIDAHDHPFEESYFIVQGRVRATADGKTFDLGPGDVIWTGVGCIHSFENVSNEAVRWIETQAPLPPAKEVFRFERDLEKFA